MRSSLCVLVFLVLLVPALAQEHQHTVFDQPEPDWQEGPTALGRGARMAVLYGDPKSDGIFVMRVRLPPAFKIMPHTHATDEVLTVISGDVSIGAGTVYDQSKMKTLVRGGLMAMPPGFAHYAYTISGATIQISTRGPWQVTYVNSDDDPRRLSAVQTTVVEP